MGWCQEFGVQIRDGCDHLMVAGATSCTCAACGVGCPGKFAGCPTVWAAGPVQVTLRSAVKEPALERRAARPGPPGQAAQPAEPAATNGKAPPARELSIADRSGELHALIQSLRSEIQLLNRKIDRVQDRAQAGEDAAKAASQAAAELPQRMGRAVSAALQQQHGAILDDLAGLRKQVTADLGQLGDKLRQPSDLAAQAAIIGELDTRFEWLVNELSDRFIVLGNEVARIKQQLAGGSAEAVGPPRVPNRLHRA